MFMCDLKCLFDYRKFNNCIFANLYCVQSDSEICMYNFLSKFYSTIVLKMSVFKPVLAIISKAVIHQHFVLTQDINVQISSVDNYNQGLVI